MLSLFWHSLIFYCFGQYVVALLFIYKICILYFFLNGKLIGHKYRCVFVLWDPLGLTLLRI